MRSSQILHYRPHTMPDLDPRIQKLEAAVVYGIYHHNRLVYVGATRKALSRRLDYHRHKARRGASSPFYRYLQTVSQTERLRDVFTIKPLDVDTEQEAIDRYDTLNVRDATPLQPYSGHAWASEDLDLLGTMPDQALADRLGIATYEVQEARAKLAIDPHAGARTVKMPDWGQWDHLLGTMTDEELANLIGCTGPAVCRRRLKLGIEPFFDHGRLGDEAAFEIRRRYKTEDVSYSDLGDDYDVDKSTIGQIVRGETYKHVPMT